MQQRFRYLRAVSKELAALAQLSVDQMTVSDMERELQLRGYGAFSDSNLSREDIEEYLLLARGFDRKSGRIVTAVLFGLLVATVITVARCTPLGS